MIKIGDKKLIFSETFLARDNEEIFIEIPLADGIAPLRISLTFKPDAEEGRKGQTTWNAQGNNVSIVCYSWVHPSNSTLQGIAKIGELQGEPLGFFMGHSMYADGIHGVVFQVYHGGKYA